MLSARFSARMACIVRVVNCWFPTPKRPTDSWKEVCASKGKKGRIYPYCTPTMTSSCVQTSRIRLEREWSRVATARLRQLQQGSVNAAQCVGRLVPENHVLTVSGLVNPNSIRSGTSRQRRFGVHQSKANSAPTRTFARKCEQCVAPTDPPHFYVHTAW